MRSDRYKDDNAAAHAKAGGAHAAESSNTGGAHAAGAAAANSNAGGTRAARHGAQKPKKKKRRIIKVLLLLILITLIAIPSAVYYMFKNAEDSLAVKINEKKLTAQVGSDLLAMDCISSYSGNLFFETGESSYSVIGSREPVSYDDFYLDTDTIGEHTVTGYIEQPILGGLLAPYKTFEFSYEVKDTTPPVILWSGEGATLQKGGEFNISDVVGYGDDSDPKPKVEYEGKVDMNEVGSYPLHVTVTDASGNSTDWNTTIYVADEIPSYEDNSEGYKFSDFKTDHAGDDRSFGLDVSSWQGDIDFKKAKKAGCEFVIIRIGFSIDGEVTIDNTFRDNFKKAREAGIKTGIYLYSYDNTEEKVRKAADWIIEELGGAELDLPVAFDWEDFGQFQTYEMSFIGLNNMYDTFEDQLSQAGYSTMLYGSLNYLEKVWTDTDKRPVWLAHYTDKTNYKGPYRIWQASSSGRISGIDGAVDMNIMYGEF